MSEVLQLSLQFALSILFPALVIRRDLSRLAPLPLSRAWNDASLWSAVVTFGPISLVVHFARTRRSLFGLGLGLFWAVAAIFASWLLASVCEQLF